MTKKLQEQYAATPLNGTNAATIEALYEEFLDSPDAVPEAWRQYFQTLVNGSAESEIAHSDIVAQLKRQALAPASRAAVTNGSGTRGVATGASEKQAAVSRLIQVYALRGHQIADIDPLGMMQRDEPSVLRFDFLGLESSDLDKEFYTGGLAGTGQQRMKLRDILALLKSIYCGTIGAEFAHISRSRERLWLREQFEARSTKPFTTEEQLWLLKQLTRGETLERYLHTKYVGQKRFSLEGGESLIPMLDSLVQDGGAKGIKEFVFGMAHRGRINVLVNVLGKPPQELFSEFEGDVDLSDVEGSGDVKYHKGFSADMTTPGGNVHLSMAFNPSHLEIVNPVVEGSVRARQLRRGDNEGVTILPILVHGDAAFAGQGVVTETFQMSQVPGFVTGGTLHIVINNQIGFTTSDPADARSTPYCSDVAKMIEAPIFHVNADDPEAVIRVTRLALDYRQKYRKDVVIDLVCYRRLGHNEADEPAATQPAMYGVIRKHKTTRQLYAQRLIQDGVVPANEPDAIIERYRARLDDGRPVPKAMLGNIGNEYTIDWSPYIGGDLHTGSETRIDAKRVARLGDVLVDVPEHIELHSRVARIMDARREMLSDKTPMDWGFAETMAYASLLDDGYDVRLTGQDSGRGTFFHRHAVLHGQQSGEEYIPLTEVCERPSAFTVTDSFLSEEAVMGFEYGFATTEPRTLVIWEGQFGDFANGAQVVIDQFISSGEAKWGRLCGLTLFLPHGYEGQGPEHSSARLERFLQLCAEHNMQVCVPSTPGQMFHMLRRQMIRPVRKPLIVLTPKSLLRHKLSVSPLNALSDGHFHEVIDEVDPIDPANVNRVVFCSGKVYYDLLEQRRAAEVADVAIVRIEQLYPFPVDDYAAALTRYPMAETVIWCQEEPRNQGAWYQIRHRLQQPLRSRHTLHYVGRHGAAAPAAGIPKLHAVQQKRLVEKALGLAPLIEEYDRFGDE
ncbi:MAG: 2-oxoglutarate dehydrogenase E1 component [Pseudomonadota bacterium]